MTNSADPDQFWKKPTDLDLQCLQKEGISGFSRPSFFQVLSYAGSNGLFHVWIRTYPLLQVGVQLQINNRIGNSVNPDETAVSSGSAMSTKVSVLVNVSRDWKG